MIRRCWPRHMWGRWKPLNDSLGYAYQYRVCQRCGRIRLEAL